jgi:hypothetical protein
MKAAGLTDYIGRPRMTSLFCRHNRFTADCPICSKGTVLDPERRATRERPKKTPTVPVRRPGRTSTPAAGVAREFKGAYVAADSGDGHEVRLEKVPGGVRLACWSGGAIERRAPVLRAVDLPRMVGEVRERSLLAPRDVEALERALAAEPADGELVEHGASAGRAGDLREELRVEASDSGRVRIARWIYRPGERVWEIQDAPVMLPAKRFAEALRAAARGGVLVRAAAAEGGEA